MADFRNTTNEFKATWEREVNFDEEAQALRTGELTQGTIPTTITQPEGAYTEGISAPEIKEIDASSFHTPADAADVSDRAEDPERNGSDNSPAMQEVSLSDKKNWL